MKTNGMRFQLFLTILLFGLTTNLFAQTELFFSEYVEGSSFNKAVEIFNGTGAAVDLSAGGYTVEIYFNGNPSPGQTINLSGVVADNDVFVLAHTSADPAILAESDQTTGSVSFNGDDAVVLRKAGAVIDAIGQVGFDPGSQWGSGDTSTRDNTIRRMSSITMGDTDETDPFDPSVEWDGFPNNDFSGLGSHSVGGGGGGPDVFFSEYIEGSSNNKALEIFNETGAAIDLAAGNYTIEVYFNGSPAPGQTINLSGVISDGDVFVIANPSADPAILAESDQTSGGMTFNGDDAIVLRKAGAVIDAIGQVGFDPGSQWGSGDTSTQDNTIRRKLSVTSGDTDETDPFDPTIEWDGFLNNDFSDLGRHGAPAGGAEVFFSEYIEGSSNNKALEIFNNTGADIDLDTGNYEVEIYFNGNTSAGQTIGLTGVITNNDVYVIANSSADPAILAQADQSTGSLTFNGDDAVVLRKAGAVIDAIGQVGFDPGSQWGSGLTSTQDNTLRRKAAITAGDTDETDPFDPATEWDGFAQDNFGDLGMHLGLGGLPSFELLISEIVVTPTTAEFVEIFNPTADSIDLSDVYLTDATFAGGGTFYYNIVTGTNAGGGGFADFHARFPDGAAIAPGEFQTIALAGSGGFATNYGLQPTYELFEDGTPDAVPDMREALPGSINNQGGLTNSGEVVILYFWNGASDLVADLDYALWGDRAEAVSKTGVAIDGPDSDSDPSTYKNDTSVGAQRVISGASHASGNAWHRQDFDEGSEITANGNGLTGNDETSEDLDNTFIERVPTPNETFPAEPPAQLLLTEIVVTPTAGEYLEIHNATSQTIDLSTYYLTDATFTSGGQFYYNIVTGANAGGGTASDFNARFPDGATIAPGEFQTVAIAGSDDFMTTYGVQPTYELFEDGAAADGVPDMVEALPGSINNQGGLTNSGEVAILYYWDGRTDLVIDIDYAVWGDKAEAVDKTGIIIDGPDSDSDPSAYLNDTAIGSQEVVAAGSHGTGSSFQRFDLAEGSEVDTGGNGVNGNDETSEPLAVTWQTAAVTPGTGAPSGWVINEIHADPDATLGDANGDGTVDTQEDEFVEIINASGVDQDVSGWTLSDGFGVRHTFAPGTIIEDQCSVLIFGDGPFLANFGGALLQEASSGALGLNNSGDDLTLTADNGIIVASVSYGSEGGDNQSITRDPDITGNFVKHTAASGSGGALFSAGRKVDGTQFPGCIPEPTTPLEIFAIQSPGLASPFSNLDVTTVDNVVTAVTPTGFFMQTPVARTDNDPETSDGMFVFTGSAPAVAVGDLVDVSGLVVEFFDLTEYTSGPTITIKSSGNPLPPPIVFDENTPSPIQPQPANEVERYEGMLVQVIDGTATGPSDRFGDIAVVAKDTRVFREPGIAFPGLPGLPVWDGNPEVFEIDPDGAGLPNVEVPAGALVNATGPLTFSFGDYQIAPTSFSFEGGVRPRTIRAPVFGEFTIATQNVLRLFDDDPVEFATKLAKLSQQIVRLLRVPDILAVQEVENLTVLQALADAVNAQEPAVTYTPILIEGNDPGGIDVGYLVRDGRIRIDNVTQFGASETFEFGGNIFTTHDRPPLILEAAFLDVTTPFPITVMNLHNRSLNDVETNPFVRVKRDAQAKSIAGQIQAMQEADPDINLVVTGDFNAFQFSDGFVDVTGQISGQPDPAGSLIPATDIVNPDLTVEVLSLPPGDRYSFVQNGSAQVFDHMLTSETLSPKISDLAYARGNADAPAGLEDNSDHPLRSSDHDGLVMFVRAAPTFHEFVFLADHHVKLLRSKHERRVGDIHSNRFIFIKRGEPTTYNGSLFAAGNIKIHSRNTINGDAFAGGDLKLGKDVVITGTAQSGANVPVIPLPVLDYTAGGEDFKVRPGGALFLEPGTYDKVKVKDRGRLTLTAGEYFVNVLRLEDKATLECDVSKGPISINIVNRLRISEESVVAITPGGESNSELVTFSTRQTDVVQLGKDTYILGTIIAPEAEVLLRKELRFRGAICAKTITVERNVMYLHHEAPGSLGKQPVIEPAEEEVAAVEIVTEYALAQNYPNPFNAEGSSRAPSTTFEFALPQAGDVQLAIYDLNGKLVRRLINREMPAGRHQISWDGHDRNGQRVASGVYLYRLKAGDFLAQKKLTLTK